MDQHRQTQPLSNWIDEEERALTIRFLGWMLLALNGLILVYVPISYRIGSLFWIWWFVAQGTLGAGLLVYADRVAAQIALTQGARRPASAQPSVSAESEQREGMPPDEQRAA